MKLVFINDFGYEGKSPLPSYEKLLSIIEKKVRKEKGILNLVLTDDSTILKLNHDHRGQNKTTDVLTFNYVTSQLTGSHGSDELIGEIYISIPAAKRQAKIANWGLLDELNKLFVHGILHFLGFDHVKEKDFRVMKLLEDKVIISFGGKPYECS